jgi:hypothetical protein
VFICRHVHFVSVTHDHLYRCFLQLVTVFKHCLSLLRCGQSDTVAPVRLHKFIFDKLLGLHLFPEIFFSVGRVLGKTLIDKG